MTDEGTTTNTGVSAQTREIRTHITAGTEGDFTLASGSQDRIQKSPGSTGSSESCDKD